MIPSDQARRYASFRSTSAWPIPYLWHTARTHAARRRIDSTGWQRLETFQTPSEHIPSYRLLGSSTRTIPDAQALPGPCRASTRHALAAMALPSTARLSACHQVTTLDTRSLGKSWAVPFCMTRDRAKTTLSWSRAGEGLVRRSITTHRRVRRLWVTKMVGGRRG